MSTPQICAFCEEEFEETTAGHQRIRHLLREYLCPDCIPSDIFDKFTDNPASTPDRVVEGYLYGLFAHMGVWLLDKMAFVPSGPRDRAIITAFAQHNILLQEYDIKHVGEMAATKTFICSDKRICDIARSIFNYKPKSRLYNDIDPQTTINIDPSALTRALVDCNFEGDSTRLNLTYQKPITTLIQAIPAYSNTNGIMESKVFTGIQLSELLGLMYEGIMAYQCLTTYMAQTYPPQDDFNRQPSEDEIKDRQLLEAHKTKSGFFVADHMAACIEMMAPTPLRFVKVDPLAIIPTKAHPTDIGFDMTLIKKLWRKGKYEMYDTGVIVIPSTGVFTQIVARSSIYKVDRSLANAVGIIDPTYRGTLRVILKVDDPETPELALPSIVTQLIPAAAIYAIGFESATFDTTKRQDGGFGSTNVASPDLRLAAAGPAAPSSSP